MSEQRRNEVAGTLSAFSAFVMWGVLPYYWHALDSVPAIEILAHRISWAALLMIIVVPLTQRRELAAALHDGRALLVSAGAGFVVGVNWFIFTWSATSGRLVEASLGYYINPLVTVLLGIIFLRERLTKVQGIALGLAAVGVLVLAVSYGSFPWVSVALAFSFGFYGLIKKVGRLNASISLLVELLVLAPLSVTYLALRARAGAAAFGGGDARITLMLGLAGIVTVVPLLLFGGGTRRIPLARVGFLQYIAPTLMLIIGTLSFGERFTTAHAVSFAFIWVALAIYSTTLVRRVRAQAPADAEADA